MYKHHLRRETKHALKERSKAAATERHLLYGIQPAHQRLKSRQSFLRSTEDYEEPRANVDLWEKTSNQHWMEPKEQLAPGSDENWETWRALNRLRTGTARSGALLPSGATMWTPTSANVEHYKPPNICILAHCAPPSAL